MRLLRGARQRQVVLVSLTLAAALWAAVFLWQARAGRAQRHIDSGIEYVRIGKPIEAEREWREAAKLSPNNATVWELLSELYINTEQWSKGTDALKQLLRTAPNRPYIYSRLAACALRSGDEAEAKRLAEEELKHNPGDEASLAILAFLSNMQDDVDQQIDYLKRLLARTPNDPDTLHDLAQAYSAVGKYAEVLPILDRLIALRPKDGYPYALRAAAKFETDASQSATSQAEADLLKSLQLTPLSAFSRFTLGRLYLREGQFQKAIFQLELAQKLNPQKMDVPFALATAYARAGQPAKAASARQRFETLRTEVTLINVLKKRCVLEKDNYAIHLQLGQLMLKHGEERQALYYLQRALAINPQSAAAKEGLQKLDAQLKSAALSSSL